jgi:hypothetical protein
MPTLLERYNAPVKGAAPGFGSGAQPARRTTVEMNRPAQTTPARSLGSFTSSDFSPKGNQLNPMYDESRDPVASPRPIVAARPPAPRLPVTPVRPDITGLQPGSFAMQNTLNNAGVYAPGSVGEANAAANGTGYRPPQQTERANPLTGDSNAQMPGTTATIQRPPFVQRGASVPQGQDAAPIIGGTGPFARKFSSGASADLYSGYIKRLFDGR